MKIVLDCHCHTIASGHAYSTITEYASEASKKGLELIAITDHAPKTPGMAFGGIYFLNLKTVPDELFGVEILKGVELNILNANGDIDLSEDLLRPLDVVIASLHDVCIRPGTVKQNTRAVIGAIQNPYIKIIGHLGDPMFPIDVKDIVKAAADHHVALEMNEASCTGYRAGGEKTIVEMAALCKSMGVPVVLGSDAHFHTQLGQFGNVLRLCELAGLEEEDVLNTSAVRFKEFVAKL